MSDDTLNHPCKQTCSGWKQGYEAGLRAKVYSNPSTVNDRPDTDLSLAEHTEREAELLGHIADLELQVCRLKSRLAESEKVSRIHEDLPHQPGPDHCNDRDCIFCGKHSFAQSQDDT